MGKPAWSRHLSIEGKDARVIGAGHQVLFDCQQPGVPFRWHQIVHRAGNIYGVRVLPVIVPEDVLVAEGDSGIDIIHEAGLTRCSVVFVHETRPYPALIEDYPGETLLNFPGGVVDDDDVSLAGAGIRELTEELGVDPKEILAEIPFISVPTPASGAAQLEAFFLHCVIYKGRSEFRAAREEGVEGFEIVPLRSAYSFAKERHESKQECVDMKVFLLLLLLQQEYLWSYGLPLYVGSK